MTEAVRQARVRMTPMCRRGIETQNRGLERLRGGHWWPRLGSMEGQSMGIIRQLTPTFVVALLAMLQGSPARAGFENGNRLYEYCSKPNEVFCLGYVMGVIDGARVNWKKENLVCVPDHVMGRQARDIVTKFLRDTPQDRQLDADVLIARALHLAWSCPK
jgi:hypothetical protein